MRDLSYKGSVSGASGRAAASSPNDASLIPLSAGLFIFLSQRRVLIQVPRGGAGLIDFPDINRRSCAA